MHGWGDSCVTEERVAVKNRASCKTLTGIFVQNEPIASSKYAVNVNGHSQRHQRAKMVKVTTPDAKNVKQVMVLLQKN